MTRGFQDEDTAKTVDFTECSGIAETEKAVLVRCVDWKEDMWIPKSQIHDDSEVYGEGHEGKLVITQWIAERKGLV